MINSDFLIIGAGIVGLTIANELKRRLPKASIAVIEKESRPGLHSSGRNSGVLHSGIYYPPNTLKSQVCSQGSKEMTNYCEENNLPILKCGKFLISTRQEDEQQIEHLYNNAKKNGISVEKIDQKELKNIEPDVASRSSTALYVPTTSVANSQLVLESIVRDSNHLGVEIFNNMNMIDLNLNAKKIKFNTSDTFSYGHLINTAGLHADKIAHKFGVGHRYTILPFKGIYWELDPKSDINLNHLIYPVPDLRVPFLGVHTTLSTEGKVYIGPTAIPALGRENYHGLEGINLDDSIDILLSLSKQMILGKNGFRRLAWNEGRRIFKPWFLSAAQALLPKLKSEHLLPSEKVGIRAQLYDKNEDSLVNDFLVKCGPSSTHVLNAISPAWTSSFPFARYITDGILKRV